MTTTFRPASTRRPAARQQPPAATSARAPAQTTEEAQARYYAAYGPRLVAALFGAEVDEPTAIEEWRALARATAQLLQARAEARAQLRE